ncbi:TetR family transcriptional regulator [Amycolatopsis ultiminotia]|uniref:TetR family transcriptional regulator n=1 Tax=Amycolatopsis ultiminotia TaxID=543629 RepID=A0ABP6VEX3_9PSEU
MRTETTEKRILAAATAEFAAHGFGGARVDRIAAAAKANKERIYAYFGNKQRLFSAVLQASASRPDGWTDRSAADLPAAAGDLFDLAFRAPEILRLMAWRRLEDPDLGRTSAETESYRRKIEQIRAAQQAGEVDASWDAGDLMAIIGALAGAWTDASASLVELAEADGPPVHTRRAAIEEALRRIIAPAHPGAG